MAKKVSANEWSKNRVYIGTTHVVGGVRFKCFSDRAYEMTSKGPWKRVTDPQTLFAIVGHIKKLQVKLPQSSRAAA